MWCDAGGVICSLDLSLVGCKSNVNCHKLSSPPSSPEIGFLMIPSQGEEIRLPDQQQLRCYIFNSIRWVRWILRKCSAMRTRWVNMQCNHQCVICVIVLNHLGTPLRNNLWRRMQAFSMIISFLNVLSPRTRMDRSAMTSSRQWSTHQRCKNWNSSNRSKFPSSAAWAPKTYLGRPGLCQPSHSTAATDIIGIDCDDCDNSSLTMNCTLGTLVYICAVCTLSAVTLRGNMLNFNFGWLRHFVFTLSLPKPRAIATRRRKPQIDPF